MTSWRERIAVPAAVSWPKVMLALGVAVVLVVLGIGVRGLFAPVERAGNPTIPVPPPTAVAAEPTLSPSSSPSASGSPSASPSGTPSATAPVPGVKASGKFNWSSGVAAAAGSSGTLHSYVVAVETTAKVKANSAAGVVAGVLNDPRSWTGGGTVRFALIADAKKADVVVYLASTATATKLCGSAAESAYTCRSGSKVVINADRWAAAPATYAADLQNFRRFLVNHAVGHYLDRSHASCAKKGGKASVMQQQSTDLGGCTPNPWP
ncbi:MAG: DUF3152 domain-containing protein [Micropruina sp.]|nr:DUF3152 domain-containing protein [Micropruina sp.]